MLEFLFSAGLSSTLGCQMQYNGYSGSFLQAAIIDGPPTTKQGQDKVKACWMFNTAFGSAEFSHIWPAPQTTVGFHMHVNFAWDGRHSGALVSSVQEWYRFYNGSALVLALKLDGLGTMQVIAGTGVSVGVLGTTFFYDTHYELEVKTGIGGWSVKVNGVVEASSSSPISSTLPDRGAVRWQGFGPPGVAWCNYALWDDRPGDGITDFLGSCWVSTIPLVADVNQIWAANPGPAIYTALRDLSAPFTPADPSGAPDGDASYATPTAVSPPQLFQIGQPGSPCFGQVLAVAVNVCGKANGADQLVTAWTRPKRTLYALGNVQLGRSGTQFTVTAGGPLPLLENYQTWQVIATKSPESMTNWLDAEIASAQWGLAPSSSGNEAFRVTQMFVTKLTSLGTNPFSCGGGPYVY